MALTLKRKARNTSAGGGLPAEKKGGEKSRTARGKKKRDARRNLVKKLTPSCIGEKRRFGTLWEGKENSRRKEGLIPLNGFCCLAKKRKRENREKRQRRKEAPENALPKGHYGSSPQQRREKGEEKIGQGIRGE